MAQETPSAVLQDVHHLSDRELFDLFNAHTQKVRAAKAAIGDYAEYSKEGFWSRVVKTTKQRYEENKLSVLLPVLMAPLSGYIVYTIAGLPLAAAIVGISLFMSLVLPEMQKAAQNMQKQMEVDQNTPSAEKYAAELARRGFDFVNPDGSEYVSCTSVFTFAADGSFVPQGVNIADVASFTYAKKDGAPHVFGPVTGNAVPINVQRVQPAAANDMPPATVQAGGAAAAAPTAAALA